MLSVPPRIILIALLLLTVLRMAVAAAYPLVDDETYYWVWSRHLAWGYPDHPPAVAAMVRVTTTLAGDSALGVRLGPLILAVVTSLFVFDLTRRMFDSRAATLATTGYQILPVAAVGAIFAAPDAPLIFFWVLAIWFLWRALSGGRTWNWYGAGLAVGLALMSKLSALFLAASLAGFLLFSPAGKSWLRRAEPYHAAAIALAACYPLVAWNSRHDSVTFLKLLNPTPWIDLGAQAKNAAAFVGTSAVYYGPITVGLLLAALGGALARREDERYRLLSWLAVPLIAFTFITSFEGIPKPHWPAPAYLILLLPAAALWPSIRGRRGWGWATLAGVGLNILIIGALYALPFLPNAPGSAALRGWDEAAAVVGRIYDAAGDPDLIIMTGSYQNASQLAYHFRERYPITTALRDNAIALRMDPRTMIDRNAVFITDHNPGPGLPIHLMFRHLQPQPDLVVRTGTSGTRRFQIYFGYGFRGFPRPRFSPI